MRRRANLQALAAGMIACGAMTVGGTAEAYCPVGQAGLGVPQYTFDAADLPVPVFLVTSSSTMFDHDTDDVGRLVGRAVDAMNRYGMSEYTLRYGGTITPIGAFFYSGAAIFVRSTSNCNFCPNGASACMTAPTVDGAGHIDRADLYFVHNPTTCPTVDWQFYPDYAGCAPGACADDLQGTVMHELGHAAGLAHSGTSGNCAGDVGTVGIMSGNGGTSNTEQRYLSRDDVDGLVSLYGRRFGRLDYHYSYDGGLSWGDGGLLGSTNSYSPLSSVSTATEGETELYFGYHANPLSWLPYSRSMSTSTTSTVDQLGGMAVFHPQPVAFGDGILMAARFVDETPTNNSKKLRFAWSYDGGNLWSATDALYEGIAPVRTRRNGLAVAYDPKTVQFIAAYVGDDNIADNNGTKCDDTVQGVMCDELRVVTFDPSTGEQQHTGLGVRTATAPSIACGDTTSWRNCVISWVSTTANACVHWGHGRILPDGSFELYNDLSTGCYQGYSAPAVTFDATEPSNPWRMALTQEVVNNDDRIYTFRKASGYNSAWTDQRSFAVANGFRILGDIGLLHAAGGSEKAQVMYLRK